MKDKAKYVRWGLTAFLVGCALLIFYDVFYRDNAGTVQAFFGKLWSILAPVLYGLAMAYLLAPLVNHLERWILRAKDALEKKEAAPPRCAGACSGQSASSSPGRWCWWCCTCCLPCSFPSW